MVTKHSGSGWIAAALKINDMSLLGVAVANLLGDVFLGIYHLPTRSLVVVNWRDDTYIEVTIGGELSSVDNDLLTRLLVLCHDRMLRVGIKGIGPGYVRLSFSQRHQREGKLWDRCPTIEEHITVLRGHYGEPTI